jgi:hypothetical protein
MVDTNLIREHMEVVGADGVHVGTVDAFENGSIKLTKKDSGQGSHEGHHHSIPAALIAAVEGNRVRLSANADVAVSFEEEASRRGSSAASREEGSGVGSMASRAVGTMQDRASQGYEAATEAATRGYEATTRVAGRGYEEARRMISRTPSLSDEIAYRPFLAVGIAALLGGAVGWALRGASEDQGEPSRNGSGEPLGMAEPPRRRA